MIAIREKEKKTLKTCMLLSALLRRGCLIKYRNKPIDLIAFNFYMRVFVAIDQGIHHTHTRAFIFFHQAAVRKMYVLCNPNELKTQNICILCVRSEYRVCM